MAKGLKPSLGTIEASYTVNSYAFSQYYPYPECPLFDGNETPWRGGSEAYWYNAGGSFNYLDITIDSWCNIHRLSQVDYYAESHQQPFTIEQRENDIWVDVTDKYPQILEYRPSSWVKTISNLPKGRYRFTATCRMDAEWLIEKTDINYALYLKDDTIYGMQMTQ